VLPPKRARTAAAGEAIGRERGEKEAAEYEFFIEIRKDIPAIDQGSGSIHRIAEPWPSRSTPRTRGIAPNLQSGLFEWPLA
jgi:hypothetical protein